ncbi:hypothetical protein V8F20_004767 [Naviculisporaceae sp. PSN 640]
MSPPPGLQPTTTPCDCPAKARELVEAVALTASNPSEGNSIPVPGQQSPPTSSPSVSLSSALIEGKAIIIHWKHLSTICPNSASHLSSTSILRDVTAAMYHTIQKYKTCVTQRTVRSQRSLEDIVRQILLLRAAQALNKEIKEAFHVIKKQLFSNPVARDSPSLFDGGLLLDRTSDDDTSGLYQDHSGDSEAGLLDGQNQRRLGFDLEFWDRVIDMDRDSGKETYDVDMSKIDMRLSGFL